MVTRIGAWTGTLKNPTKCLWRWERDRRYNFFFGPPTHLCRHIKLRSFVVQMLLLRSITSFPLCACVTLCFVNKDAERKHGGLYGRSYDKSFSAVQVDPPTDREGHTEENGSSYKEFRFLSTGGSYSGGNYRPCGGSSFQ